MKERNYIEGIFNNKKYIVLKLKDNSEENIEEAIIKIYEKLEWSRFISKNTVILLKPNFTNLTYIPGVTTSPLFLEIVVKILSDRCKKIKIIEGNGGSWMFDATDAARNHGVFKLIERYPNVEWINISDLPRKLQKKKINNKNLRLELPENVAQLGDLLISLPVFKNHCMTTVTLGIKNLWGLEPNELRMLNHSKIDYYLPMIGDFYKHKLTLIDGTIGLAGNGPMWGDAIEMRTILGANDPAVADVIGAWIMKTNPANVKHIVEYCKYYHYEINKILNTLPEKSEQFRTELKMERVISNYLDLLTFKNRFISKIVFNSIFTPIIYWIFNLLNGDRESIPPKKLKEKFDKKKTKREKK
ncbi:MAG: DUF362 domain-containing protein [Candidatus Lokiarchaeota archaeon]|nr:DUF362 domain-containing protein [Candidatus Harpocratesius repetitus]